jgi:hypothetical protein
VIFIPNFVEIISLFKEAKMTHAVDGSRKSSFFSFEDGELARSEET